MPSNTANSEAATLEELLSYHDEHFIHSAYHTLLGRAPDPEGFKYYLGRIRQGVSKEEILRQLRSSREGMNHAPQLHGLDEVLRRQWWQRLPYVRPIINLQFEKIKRSQRVIENQRFLLDKLNKQLALNEKEFESLLADFDRQSSMLKAYTATPDYEWTIKSPSISSKYEFDADWYLSVYPDVSAAGCDPLEHYLSHGKADDRFCCHAELLNTLFDACLYLEAYPDVASAAIDPLEHYMTQGKAEGRVGARLSLSLFDPEWYLKRNPDVASAGVDPLEHYMKEGRAQKRSWSSFKEIDNIEAEPLVYSEHLTNTQVKLIAFYLPQFHPIPENDKWWGKGFTEWTNVSRAKSFYDGHEQPRLPGELGFYDLRLVDVMKRQAELARTHGLHGFCFYIYWFGGKRLLESPVEMLLRHPEIDINFCYCWANENWTRRWDGLENDILIGQSHSPEDDISFISTISPAFMDKRYIRVEGKPMLIVYRPSLFPDIKKTVHRWRDWCRKNGIGEIHVSFTESFDKGNPADMGMDASIEFPPSSVPHQEITKQVKCNDDSFRGQVHNYMVTAKSAKSYTRPKWVQYRGLMPSWDNTARKMERGISFYGATPELYAEWLDSVVAETNSSLTAGNKLVFINAWNEWGEGAYLEPDRRRGYAYLNRTREVMAKYSDSVINQEKLLHKKKSNDLAVIVHLHYGDLFDVIANYLDNFSGAADLYFSIRDGCFPEMVKIIAQRYPDAVAVSYPNHGRDVVPFLRIFSHIENSGYKAICKIHSKKSKHRADGDQWRDDVLNKLLGNKTAISSCLDKIESGAGIVAPAGHLLHGSNYWGTNAKRVTELALKMGCPLEWVGNFCFPAGTMFWFKPDALKPLMGLNLQSTDFEAEDGQVDGTTAHAVERLIGLSAMRSNFRIEETVDNVDVGEVDYPFAAKSN